MEAIDDQTTVIFVGDHGLNLGGNHGGSTENEIRTVMFAYQKTPFPMANLLEEYPKLSFDF